MRHLIAFQSCAASAARQKEADERVAELAAHRAVEDEVDSVVD